MVERITAQISRLVLQYASGLFSALLGLIVLVGWVLSYHRVGQFLPEIVGFERNVVWGVQQLMLGRPVYTDVYAGPMAPIQYGPLYYHLAAWFNKLAGSDAQISHSVYFYSRLFSWLCQFGTALLLFAFSRNHLGISKVKSLWLVGLYFAFSLNIMQAARPDSLKQLLVFGSAYLIYAGLQKSTLIRWVGAGLLAGLAFLTKQDAIFLLVGLGFATLLAWRDKWAYLGLGVAVVVMLAGSTVLIGSLGLANMKLALSNGIKLTWFFTTFKTYLPLIAVVLGPAMLLSLKGLASDKSSTPTKWLGALVLIYIIGQLLLSLKYGSAPLYFNEPILLSLCIIGWSLKDLDKKALAPYALFTLLIMNIVWLGESVIGLATYNRSEFKDTYVEQIELTNQIKASFAGKQVLVLTAKQYEDAMTTSLPLQVVMAQRDVWKQIYDALGPEAVKPAISYLKSAGPDCLITDKGTKPSFLDVDLSASYSEAFTTDHYTVWRKR